VINVTIGSVNCSNVVIVTPDTSITCWMPGSSQAQSHVCVDVDGAVNTDNNTAFSYLNGYCGDRLCVSPSENCVTCSIDCGDGPCGLCGDGFCSLNETCSSCVNDCGLCSVPCVDPQCSNQGVCTNGVCDCNGNFSGPTCAEVPLPFNVSFQDGNTPAMSLSPKQEGKPGTFQIGINRIYEIDGSGNEIHSIQFNTTQGLNFSSSESSASMDWFIDGHLENKAFLEVHVTYFTTSNTIFFANATFGFAADTLKYSFNISNWPFQSIRNQLVISLQQDTPQSSDSACSQVVQQDPNGNVIYFQVIMNNTLLYARMIQQLLLDGRQINAKSSFVASSNELLITVPYFWNYVFIDPSYAVLLADQSQNNCVSQTPPQNYTIAIAVGVSVGGFVIALIILGFVFYPKLHTLYSVLTHKNEEQNGKEIPLDQLPKKDDHA